MTALTPTASPRARPPVAQGIEALVGDTPLVQLNRHFVGMRAEMYGKLEGFNPGGSIKDRPALRMLTEALSRGELGSSSTVIESSSGNMAIGLAQACAVLRLPMIAVLDPMATAQNVRLLSAYGVRIETVTIADHDCGFVGARLARVRELLKTIPGAFWPNQYENRDNPAAHHSTMREIHGALGRVDWLFCAVSSGGTLTGCGEYLRLVGAATQIVAVDAAGSVLFGGSPANRLIPGHGSSIVPPVLQQEMADHVVTVTDDDCVVACRHVLRTEGLLLGGSSGAVLAAMAKMQLKLLPGQRCVGILADRGERYLDNVFDDAWVSHHLPSASKRLQSSKEKETF